MTDPTMHESPDAAGVQWLDEEHVLEPVLPGAVESRLTDAPVVKDVHGRLWRVRRRTTPWASIALLVALVLVLALIWLAAAQY